MKKIDPYHVQLRQYMEARSLDNKTLNELLDEGTSIRTIQKYMIGELVPRYERAKKIFDILKVRISHEDLTRALALTREYSASLYKDKSRYFYEKHIRLRLDNFNFGTDDPGVVRNIIDKRVGDAYGYNDNAFTKYITDLIQKDIESGKNYESKNKG